MQKDDYYELIKKIRNRYKTAINPVKHSAEKLSKDDLLAQTEQEQFIDLYKVRNDFKRSGQELFIFLLTYNFVRKVEFEERVTLYCQVISMFENELELSDNYLKYNNIEYAEVYPK